MPNETSADIRVNVTGNQGNRVYLSDRGVSFDAHNPTLGEIDSTILRLTEKHKRHAGHKGCAEAAALLLTLTDWCAR